MKSKNPQLKSSTIDWLLDSDPSIRWQVMKDILDEPDEIVARERSRISVEGWGARLLDLQAPDGHWGGAAFVNPGYTSTSHTLTLLQELGVDPNSERAKKAVALVRDNCTWGEEFGNSPFFEGEVEPCINGRALAAGAYFGEESDSLLERLLSEQQKDGGWNCEAPQSKRSSFHSTICVLEGLLEYENAKGSAASLREARRSGEEYLLERKMLRRLSTNEVIKSEWTLFSFPTYWHYDVLRGLDYLRRAGARPDERVTEAIELVKGKQNTLGQWPLENPHPGEGHFAMEEGAGTPSRWNTLRALRVLDWYEAA